MRDSFTLDGIYSAEIKVGLTCSETDNLLIAPPPDLISGDRRACVSITAGGVEVVRPGSDFEAGVRLTLGAGFTVGDTRFTAVLDESLAGPVAYLREPSPAAESTYKASFLVYLRDLSLGDDDRLEHLTGRAADGSEQFQLFLQRDAGTDRLVLAARLDDGSTVQTDGSETPLVAGWNRILLDWSAGPGASGHLLVKVNEAPAFVGLFGLDNGGGRIDEIRWGAVGGDLNTVSGSLRLDRFSAWR